MRARVVCALRRHAWTCLYGRVAYGPNVCDRCGLAESRMGRRVPIRF